MNLVIRDPATLQQLSQAVKPVSLLDSAGNVIGEFIPKRTGREPPPLSQQEIERRLKEPGRPLADILADLEKRA